MIIRIICSRGSDEYLALFFFAAVCLTGPFTGAHINPAVLYIYLDINRLHLQC